MKVGVCSCGYEVGGWRLAFLSACFSGVVSQWRFFHYGGWRNAFANGSLAATSCVGPLGFPYPEWGRACSTHFHHRHSREPSRASTTSSTCCTRSVPSFAVMFAWCGGRRTRRDQDSGGAGKFCDSVMFELLLSSASLNRDETHLQYKV